MPNTHSAKKRLRQNEVRRARNRAGKSRLRTQVRRCREAVAAGDLERAESEFRATVKACDKAASKGLIHANAAARTKSRISAKIKAMKQAAA